jgi:hypothetical protein
MTAQFIVSVFLHIDRKHIIHLDTMAKLFAKSLISPVFDLKVNLQKNLLQQV